MREYEILDKIIDIYLKSSKVGLLNLFVHVYTIINFIIHFIYNLFD